MKYLAVVLISVIFFSCNPVKRIADNQRQYQNLVDEYIKNHPAQLDTTTKYAHGNLKSDTTSKTTTTVNIDTTRINDTVIIEKHYYNTETNTINNNIHDTLTNTIVDKEQLNICERKNTKLEHDLENANNKIKANDNWRLYCIISGLLNIILTLLIIIMKFKFK